MKKRFLATLAVACLIATGCNGGEEPEEQETAGGEEAAETGRESITVTGREYSFELPETVPGGFVDVEFNNEGRLVHEAAFIKVDPEMPQDQFIRDLKTASGEEGGPIAAYLKPYAAGFFTQAGDSETIAQSLPGGTYFVVCTLTDLDSVEEGEGAGQEEGPPLPQHFEQGMIKRVTVDGPAQVDLPDADKVIAATEYTFDVTGLEAGRNEMLFRNDGPAEIHMAAVLEFGEGVDEAAAGRAIEAFNQAEGGPPPEGTPEPRDVAFAGVYDVGGGQLVSFEARSGRVYAFLCFIQDRAGGPPHVAKGMSRLVTVA